MNQAKIYNRIAEKFGQYSSGSQKTYRYFDGDPEKVFWNLLRRKINKSSRVLDLGCADGRFTLKVAPLVSEIVGIDLSRSMLKVAARKQKEQGIKNAKFVYGNKDRLNFKKDYFDLVFSRRGPTINKKTEALKPGGVYLEIRVGALDCFDLQQLFKRGQFYGRQKNTREEIKEYFKDSPWQIKFLKEYFYDEIYPDGQQLSLMLQAAPIIEDYDPKKDKKNLAKYCLSHQSKSGIHLKRHRLVYWARKK